MTAREQASIINPTVQMEKLSLEKGCDLPKAMELIQETPLVERLAFCTPAPLWSEKIESTPQMTVH